MARGPNFVAHIDFLVDRPGLDKDEVYLTVRKNFKQEKESKIIGI